HHRQASHARAGDVRAVEAMRDRPEARESEGDGEAREEEGHEEREIDGEEMPRLRAIPEELERIERHAFGGEEGERHGKTEEPAAADEKRGEVRQCALACDREQSAARTVAAERGAQDQV